MNNSEQEERRMRAKELFDKHCPFNNAIAWSAWKMAFDLAQPSTDMPQENVFKCLHCGRIFSKRTAHKCNKTWTTANVENFQTDTSATTPQPPEQNENWQQNLIGRVKERFNELAEKEFQWRSFYHGWLEGRFDMKRSDTPPPQPVDIDKMAKDYAGKIKDIGMLLKRVIIADAFKAGHSAAQSSQEDLETRLIKAMGQVNGLELEVERLKESEAIGFAEWLQDEKYYRENNTRRWTAAWDNYKTFATSELYNLYKQTISHD